MPTTSAAKKHLRQTKKRTARNRAVVNRLRELVKKARKAITAADHTKAATAVSAATKALDKAAQNKTIERNTAGRLKSRLMRQLHALKR